MRADHAQDAVLVAIAAERRAQRAAVAADRLGRLDDLRLGGQDMFQLFTGAPIAPSRSNGFFVVGVPKGQAARLPEVKTMVDRLNAEDTPVLDTIRFRRGLLTASDRHLARYFRYVDEFPCFQPPE